MTNSLVRDSELVEVCQDDVTVDPLDKKQLKILVLGKCFSSFLTDAQLLIQRNVSFFRHEF